MPGTSSRRWWPIPTSRSTRRRPSCATWRDSDGRADGVEAQRGAAPPFRTSPPGTARAKPALEGSPVMPEPMGFFTDTTVCIGCKACEVACKEWNQLPARNGGIGTLSGDSYDNTRHLDGIHWRHVKFVEQFSPDRRDGRWLMMSDVCKHCVQAGCMEVCPTGAIIRTEFDTVYIQQDVCNGCRYCVAGCPFGVISMNEQGVAGKCTFCYHRLQAGLTPPCAQACPTAII